MINIIILIITGIIILLIMFFGYMFYGVLKHEEYKQFRGLADDLGLKDAEFKERNILSHGPSIKGHLGNRFVSINFIEHNSTEFDPVYYFQISITHSSTLTTGLIITKKQYMTFKRRFSDLVNTGDAGFDDKIRVRSNDPSWTLEILDKRLRQEILDLYYLTENFEINRDRIYATVTTDKKRKPDQPCPLAEISDLKTAVVMMTGLSDSLCNSC